MDNNPKTSRRNFLASSALLGAAAAGLSSQTAKAEEFEGGKFPPPNPKTNIKPYNPASVPACGEDVYDMRNDLEPRRLAMAMWDYSWINGHYPGGYFEDFDKAADMLIERGFNSVRIDCLPMMVHHYKTMDAIYHIPANPLASWGPSFKAHDHKLLPELIDFVATMKNKGIYTILSTWGANGQNYRDREKFHSAWEFTLNLLKEQDLLTHIAYVDFDQEFPYFSPFQPRLNELGQSKSESIDSLGDAMEAAGQGYTRLAWNRAQMDFVNSYFHSTCTYFQQRFPELRYTFSLTSYWDEVRAMKPYYLDVIELHFWIHDPRFDQRSGFNKIAKDRSKQDLREYMANLKKTLKTSRATLLQQMTNRMAKAHAWSEEIGAPLTTSEAWGPWWHMDHPHLEWDWLYEWCETCMALAENYQFWGLTPWNYCHPYWDNWANKTWYRKVNHRFLNSK